MPELATRPRVLKSADVLVAATQAAAANEALAVQAAYDEGRRSAELEAIGRQAAAAERAAAALETIARTIVAQHKATVDDTSKAVLAAAIDVAEWVLRHEIGASSKGLLARLDETAQCMLPGARTRIIVAPSELDVVTQWAAGNDDIDVVADASVAAGDARVESDVARADVSVAAALKVATEVLGVDVTRLPS